jgi:hypothetical protein
MEGEGDPSASVSSRSGDMMQERSKFESNIETEIESSKIDWSELRSRCEDDGTQVVKHLVIDVATNREIFKTLQRHPKWGDFFRQCRFGCTTGQQDCRGSPG